MTDLEQILGLLRNNKKRFNALGVNKIGVFGSFVYGLNRDSSDIDILLGFDESKENYDNFITVCNLIESILESKKVDIVTINGLSPYIGPKILEEVVYA